MKELLNILEVEQAILLMAPPGWGKTYKLLSALKVIERKVVFVFPLRCLCEEVFQTAINMQISACNVQSKMELREIKNHQIQLIVTTPECLKLKYIEDLASDYLFILDEVHLYCYWGQSFREHMQVFIERVQTYAPALILLSATVSQVHKKDLLRNLKFNYKEIICIDYGNQVLKNRPAKTYFYFPFQKKWLLDEITNTCLPGVKLVFCRYRSEVTKLTSQLRQRGLVVLSCVGGEAKAFYQQLLATKKIDFIVATSVISHGVNLPQISSIYFMGKIENPDFYLQMLGRGGRDGSQFQLHTYNREFSNKTELMKAMLSVFLKRGRNKVISFLYYVHER